MLLRSLSFVVLFMHAGDVAPSESELFLLPFFTDALSLFHSGSGESKFEFLLLTVSKKSSCFT